MGATTPVTCPYVLEIMPLNTYYLSLIYGTGGLLQGTLLYDLNRSPTLGKAFIVFCNSSSSPLHPLYIRYLVRFIDPGRAIIIIDEFSTVLVAVAREAGYVGANNLHGYCEPAMFLLYIHLTILLGR